MRKYLTKHNIALTLNITGALLIAFAFGFIPTEKGGGFLESPDGSGLFYFIYFLHPWWFRGGIFLMALGFVLQLNKNQK